MRSTNWYRLERTDLSITLVYNLVSHHFLRKRQMKCPTTIISLLTPLCFKEFRKYFIKNSALIVWKIAINSCYAGARNRNSPLWILWSIFDHFFRDVCSAKSLAHHINPSFLFSALKCKCCSKCNNGSSPTCNKAKEILSPFSLLFSPIGFYTCESEYGLKINDTQGDTTPPFLDSEKICS